MISNIFHSIPLKPHHSKRILIEKHFIRVIRGSDNKKPRTDRTTLTPKHVPIQRLTLENDLAKLVSELSNFNGKRNCDCGGGYLIRGKR